MSIFNDIPLTEDNNIYMYTCIILYVTSRIFWKSKDCTIDHSEIYYGSIIFLKFYFLKLGWFYFLGITLECCTLILTFTMVMEYKKRSTSLIESWPCPSTNTETTSSPAQVTVVEITFYLEVFNNFLLSMKESKIWMFTYYLNCWECR